MARVSLRRRRWTHDGSRLFLTFLALAVITHDLAQPNPTVLADGTRTYLPGAPGAGYDEAGVWSSGLVGQHGSLLGTVSQTGVVSALRTYDPYGAARPGSADPAGVGFSGEWRSATGLVHLRFRDYDPVLARFISRDSFGGLPMAPQTANRYAFGAGNPLTAVDPSGHFNNHLIAPVRSFVSLGVSALGPVGLGYVTLSGILGYDPIAGVSLSPEERVLFVAPAAIGAVAVVAAKLTSLAPRLATATLARADDALAFGRAAAGEAAAVERLAVEAGSAARASRAARLGDPARQALLNRIRDIRKSGGSLSEAKGIIHATREMNRLGYELLDASLAYRGRQGLDLAFFNSTTGRYAVVEAKAGTGLGRLKTYSGLRQGTAAYNESRLQRYLRYGDGVNDALVNTLLGELRARRLESFATFYRGSTTYELPLLWPGVPAVPR
ncbi:MAG: RHS repeat-associated core domain-containing protein [Chloroflexi bacterium]|nr:RHS repeat-associated core domain-containing protein [Chloroflexota bacterium]